MVRNTARPLFPKEKRVCSTQAAVRRCLYVAGPRVPWDERGRWWYLPVRHTVGVLNSRLGTVGVRASRAPPAECSSGDG